MDRLEAIDRMIVSHKSSINVLEQEKSSLQEGVTWKIEKHFTGPYIICIKEKISVVGMVGTGKRSH